MYTVYNYFTVDYLYSEKYISTSIVDGNLQGLVYFSFLHLTSF